MPFPTRAAACLAAALAAGACRPKDASAPFPPDGRAGTVVADSASRPEPEPPAATPERSRLPALLPPAYYDSLAESDSAGAIDNGIPARRMLITGVLHHDEAWEGAEKEAWTALIMGPRGPRLEDARLRMRRLLDTAGGGPDPMVDTSWDISLAGMDAADTALAVFTGIPSLKPGPVPLPDGDAPGAVWPYRRKRFRYGGAEYELLLVADTSAADPEERKWGDPEAYHWARDFRLFLARKSGNTVETQLLLAHESLGDKEVRILFAGDLDGDGRLDLLLDGSGHYNNYQPTLFLSGGREGREKRRLLRQAAWFSSLGC